MIEELKDEELIEKVHGRFHLTTLIQKRLAAMNSNNKASQFRDPRSDKKDKLECVIQEILDDKIRLDLDGEVVETQNYTDTLSSQFGANGSDFL